MSDDTPKDPFRADILERIKSIQESRKDSHEVYSRIGKIEQEQAAIVQALKSVQTTLSGLADKVTNIQDGNRTNWGTLAAWASVVVAIMVYHGNITMQPISEMSKIRHDMQQEDIEKLDKVLHREMKLIDQENQIRLDGLEKILQREIHLTKGISDERIKGIEKRLERVEGHTRELGHPDVQTEVLKQLKGRIDVIDLNHREGLRERYDSDSQ
jgi:DNA repair exonuclease SbcCD ATPase subunit